MKYGSAAVLVLLLHPATFTVKWCHSGKESPWMALKFYSVYYWFSKCILLFCQISVGVMCQDLDHQLFRLKKKKGAITKTARSSQLRHFLSDLTDIKGDIKTWKHVNELKLDLHIKCLSTEGLFQELPCQNKCSLQKEQVNIKYSSRYSTCDGSRQGTPPPGTRGHLSHSTGEFVIFPHLRPIKFFSRASCNSALKTVLTFFDKCHVLWVRSFFQGNVDSWIVPSLGRSADLLAINNGTYVSRLWAGVQ